MCIRSSPPASFSISGHSFSLHSLFQLPILDPYTFTPNEVTLSNLFYTNIKMKFTGFAVSFALAGIVSSAALPTVPGLSGSEGAIGGIEGAAEGITAGIGGAKRQLAGVQNTAAGLVGGAVPGVKRQLEVIQPVTEGVASSLNGGTGVVGSAVGTVESTGGGIAGTAEKSVTGVLGG